MIVLDTHALIWLVSAPDRLGDAAAQEIKDAELAVSTISVHEIAYLVTRGRLDLDRPLETWVRNALNVHRVRALAPTVAIAVRAGRLDLDRFPGDPADRLIYATAVEHAARLASADERLRAADPPRVIW